MFGLYLLFPKPITNKVRVKIISATYNLKRSPASGTTIAMMITAIQTSKIVANTDAYFIISIL